jgi:hypothetical protein
MHANPTARLRPLSNERIVGRHIDHGDRLVHLAAQAGICGPTPTDGSLEVLNDGTELSNPRIVEAFAVTSGGRSVHSNCSTR